MSPERPPWDQDIPSIRREHLSNARLYADRSHMIEEIGPKVAKTVVELGVAVGGFSEALIKRYNPVDFYAIDLFSLHEQEWIWGQKTSDVFHGKTHVDFYLDSLSNYLECIHVLKGDSAEELGKLEDGSVDIIYIDASHFYVDVVRNSAIACNKIKSRGGIIIFNDYILWSHLENMWYGVVPVVNDLVVNRGAKVIGFALEPKLYADIALEF